MAAGHADVDLSVVIVTHNSAGDLGDCCRSVQALLPHTEIIAVDNASTDDTARVGDELDGVTLLVNPANVGFGRACNQGADAASGSHILFVNPDVEVSRVDARALAAEAGKHPFGLVAPILEDRAGGGSIDEHWAHDLLRHTVGPLRPSELPRPRRPIRRRDGWWPAGALLLVDREEFRRVGGFDRRFFLYYEDVDLARRYRAAGLPVRMTGSMHARHRGGASFSSEVSGTALRNGWCYLSWIEYLCTWNGRDTAVRAAATARRLRGAIDRTLALLERAGPLSQRAERKRRELAALESFVRWQSSFGEGTAEKGFCPSAREIVSGL